MIEEIEYRHGPIHHFSSPAIQLIEPILRTTKLGKVIRQWHIPPGNDFDPNITRWKANQAYQLIKSGKGVRQALDETSLKWEALVKWSPYIPVRLNLNTQKLRQARKLIIAGETLTKTARLVGLSKTTLWKRLGGKRIVLLARTHENE